MTTTVNDTYKSIRSKVYVIVENQHRLTNEINALKEENAGLRAQIASLQKEMHRMKIDSEYLTVASVIAHDRAEVESARSLLAGLVRDVDRCIAELSAV
ncbi:MAG: hypothetical protein K2H33_09015 [Muribaculaceae bacterium]|nr:hypothetical protein [Muribaculaceae bacterium]MDE6119023.1 hypothetical protein [Muribaculaceae bacterium]MDE6316146.1 hypothetical protein [Muribaculaceae bacterium]